MTNHSDDRDMLVLRSWLSIVSGGGAFAHFGGIAIRKDPDRHARCYGDYQVLGRGDDGRKTLRLDHFRFKCQIDDRRNESYAWQWGYQASYGSIFGLEDFERYGALMAAIKRALDRFNREDGAADGVGRFVVRLARALKLDGIVLLETSRTGSFFSELEVRKSVTPGDYGEAIGAIDRLVLELHRACRERAGKPAA